MLNNIYNPPAAIDNILLKGVKCSMPMHLASTNTHNSATLSWVPGNLGPAESYTVAFKKNTDTSYFEITIEDTVLVLTGLEPASKYSWKVRANCSEINMSDWSEEEQFITYASLPYFCGFENLQESSPWLMYNDPSNNVNQWAIGSATQNTGNSALYISSNSGQSYAYNTGRTSAAWACLDIYLEPGHSEYQLSFDCQGMGQYGQDYMRVYLGIVSYQSAPIKNENDIPGKRLVVVKNTEAASWIKKYFKDTVEIIEVSDYFDALEELFYGRGDGLVVDNTIAIAWAADHEGYVAGMTKLGEPEVIAPAVQKGNHELLEWLNAELYELGDKGFFREAFEVTLRPKFQDAIAPEDVIIEEWRVLKLQ